MFRTKLGKPVVDDYSKPVMIPAGFEGESLDNIGPPPDVGGHSFGSGKGVNVRVWRDAWNQLFPPTAEQEQASTADEELKYQEPAIDALRLEKE